MRMATAVRFGATTAIAAISPLPWLPLEPRALNSFRASPVRNQ